MAVFALIVAVEKYPQASGLAGDLPGTNVAAKTFCAWLADKKGVFPKGHPKYDPRTFYCCAGQGVDFRTHGTTRSEIIKAIIDLERAGKDDADELYCYFSGHGFCYPRDEVVQEDIFVASDFESLKLSGGACLKIRELMDLLTPALGPGDHYYFFDACRTEVKFGEVRPIDMGVTFARSQLGFAGKAVLFSIEQGLAARTDSRFSQHLVDGLHGKGRAKGWYNNALYVKFEFLWNYVQKKINKKVSHQIGESEGLILKIDPVLPSTCVIRVDNANPHDRFVYAIKRRNATVSTGDFQGSECTVPVAEPGDYQVDVQHEGATLLRVQPAPTEYVDLYDSAEVVFRKRARGLESLAGGPSPPSSPVTGTISVLGAGNAAIRIRNDASGLDLRVPAEFHSESVVPGEYRVVLEEAGQAVARRTVTVKGGEKVEIDMLAETHGPIQEAILKQIQQPGARAVDLSETLYPPTADRDLGLWLALLGASRILGDEGEFSKLSRVPLSVSFKNIRPDGSALYVLAGIENPSGPCAIGVGTTPHWTEMTAVSGTTGLFEFSRETKDGPELLTFQAHGRHPITFSTHALPNRATLLTLSLKDGPSPIGLYQFLLPIKRLIGQLPDEVRSRIEATPLKVTRFIAQIQRLFAQDHSLSNAFRTNAAAGDIDSITTYTELIYAKWLDPIASLIAANDLLRRGILNPKSPLSQFRRLLPAMVKNLRMYFGGIPDIEALAKSIDAPFTLPTAPPILADSLVGFPLEDHQQFMPFPNDQRHFGTPWVAWVDAVKPHFPLDK